MNKGLYYWDVFLTTLIRSPRYIFYKIATIKLGAVRLSKKEEILLLKRLSIMLKAGLPIMTVLKMIQIESPSTPVRSITTTVIADIDRGSTLNQALSVYKSTFGFFTLRLIGIGERTGTLAENLEYLVVELKKNHELRKQILGALLYPAIIIMATIAITLFLVISIFPKIVPIFLSVKTTLPWSTRFLILLSDFLSNYGWHLLVLILAVSIATPFLYKVESVRFFCQKNILKLWLVGRLFKYYHLSQLSRTLGLLLTTGVSINIAIDIAAGSTENLVYKKALIEAKSYVELGKPLSSALQKTQQLFPTLFVEMVMTGERTGSVASTFFYISDIYESDIKDLTKNLTTIIEPLLMLIMGLLVGFVAISIISPIYGITQNLST